MLVTLFLFSVVGNDFVFASEAAETNNQKKDVQIEITEENTAGSTEENTEKDTSSNEENTEKLSSKEREDSVSAVSEKEKSTEVEDEEAFEVYLSATGSGTADDPYQIHSAQDFPTEIPADVYYILSSDIALETGQQIELLEGTLDGKGHTVTLADKPLANTVSGTIQNLGVTSDSAVSVSGYAGSIVVALSGTIRNCFSTASITQTSTWDEAGGLAGELLDNARIQNSYYAGTITAMMYGGIAATGLKDTAAVSNCYYTGGDTISPVSYGTVYTKENCEPKSADDFKAGLVNSLLNSGIPDVLSTGYYWVTPQDGRNNGFPVLQEGTPSADTVDKSALNTRIGYVAALIEEQYTAESWSSLQEVLAVAEAVNEKETATQTEVNTALENLSAAVNALEKKKPVEPVALPEETDSIHYITSQADLEQIPADAANQYYVLKNDITLDNWIFSNIDFNGVLDGQGHSITYNGGFTGLFLNVAKDGVVQNLHFTGKAGTSSGDGPVCRSLKGTILNCYSDVTGENACGFVKTLDGGWIVNSYSVSDGKKGVLCSKYNSGKLIHTYWQEYRENPIEIPVQEMENSYSVPETDMKSLDFVALLNQNKGANGTGWGQSSSGYPYFGENQEYDPVGEETFTNKYVVTFTPYNSTEAVTVKDQKIQLSPDYVDVNKGNRAGTFQLTGVPEGSTISWSYSETIPEGNLLVGVDAGELRIDGEGTTLVTATETKKDGTSEKVAVIRVTASSKTISSITLWLDGEDVTNSVFAVAGSEWKSIQVKARYEDADDYVPVAFSRFTYVADNPDMVYSTERSSSFYFKKPGTAVITVTSVANPEVKATVEVTSSYVPAVSVEQTIPEQITIHGRNANSQEEKGLAFNPEYYGIIVEPENASNRDRYTVTSSNPKVGKYVESMVYGYVPYSAGTTVYQAVLTDTNPDTGETNTITDGVGKTVTYVYKNPLDKVEAGQKTFEVENYTECILPLQFIGSCSGEGYSVTEPELIWTYDKENIVKIDRKALGGWKRDEKAPDNNGYFPSTDYYIYALSEGTVTATGTPVDTTNGAKPVTVTITVTPSDMPAPDIQGMLDKGTKGAVSYLQKEYPEIFQYGYEWILYTLLRSGETVSQAQINSYYYSAVNEIKKWDSSQKPTDIERTALALSILGKDITNIEGVNLASMIYNSTKLDSGSNELIYALLALDAKKTAIPAGAKWTREQMIKELLTYQNENGGFGLTDNKTTSVDITAMALQALAGYEKTNEDVKAAVEKGIVYLQNAQRADCGFGSAEATAQVLLALTALDRDTVDSKEGFGNSYQNIITNLNQYYIEQPAGFVHELGKKKPDSMATIQVLQAYTAYKRYKAGSSSYWDLTDMKDGNLVKPISITFEKSSYTIYATEKLTLKIQCEDTKDRIVQYTSSNPKILSVSQQGVIEGKKAGTVKVTAQSASGASATVSVEVKTPKVKLSTTKGKLQVKKTTTALKVVEKLDTDKVLKWTSSNKKVAAVDKKGKITAKKTGTAMITVTMKSGATAKCKVTVQKKPVKNGVRFKKSSYKLYATATLDTKCKLVNTFDTVKSYSSSNKKIVTVSKKGTLKGIKPGTARITVKTKNGAKATVKVVVKKPSVKLNKKSIKLKVKEKSNELKVKSKIKTDCIRKWKSSDPKVVSVNKNGILTAKKKGTAKITVVMKSGATASCKVKVQK